MLVGMRSLGVIACLHKEQALTCIEACSTLNFTKELATSLLAVVVARPIAEAEADILSATVDGTSSSIGTTAVSEHGWA